MKRKKWPEKGELVVCTVREVKDFGAFVDIEEYGKEGLIHISEIASGWVRYIRDYVREGQKVVCKVLHVDKAKGHIDLSLKDVKPAQRAEKIREWKNEQKAKKWLELVAELLKISEKEKEALAEKLLDAYGSIYSAFEDAAINGVESLKGIVGEEYAEGIHEVATANIKPPTVSVSANVELSCPLPNGVDVIKEALKKAMKAADGNVKLEIIYMGAPRYQFRVEAPDYKKAEGVLRKAADAAIKVVTKNKGTGVFHR
ncbi:MAG: Translation initiation factor 2 [Candidatus Alkanophagales archaeon MCA70_species_1]|nr:Translation initiation factor 2 [Candidatus Alkanophaga volatiphilum]